MDMPKGLAFAHTPSRSYTEIRYDKYIMHQGEIYARSNFKITIEGTNNSKRD